MKRGGPIPRDVAKLRAWQQRSRSPLRRNRRKPRGRPTDEQIEAKQRAACFLARFSDRPCGGQMRLCHLIPKERLRFYGVPESDIWDERVVCNGCDDHNAQCPDMEAVDPIRIPRDQLPPGLEEYAAEHRMTWWLDRAYGHRDDDRDRTGEPMPW